MENTKKKKILNRKIPSGETKIAGEYYLRRKIIIYDKFFIVFFLSIKHERYKTLFLNCYKILTTYIFNNLKIISIVYYHFYSTNHLLLLFHSGIIVFLYCKYFPKN